MKRIASIGGATLVGWILLAALDGAFATAGREPSYGELRVSEETLRNLAKHHGTHALKITETQVFIRRAGKWVPVLAL